MRKNRCVPKSVSLEHRRRMTYLGFAFYDAARILTAMIFLVSAYVRKDDFWQMEAAEAVTELVFSTLLIIFIAEMAAPIQNEVLYRRSYNFAWICASAAQFVPFAFRLPFIFDPSAKFYGGSLLSEGIALTSIIISFLGFFSLILAIYFSNKPKNWKIFLIIGISLFTIVVPFEILEPLLDSEVDLWGKVLRIINNCAPLAPCGLAIFHHFQAKKNEANCQKEQQK